METTIKPTPAFWVISVLALLWNLMGVNQYLQQAYNTESFQAMYTPTQLETINNMPPWATAAFAIAVFGGFLGCVLLLLRKKQAKLLFQISLLGIIVQMIYNFFVANMMDEYGTTAIIMPLLILIIGFYMITFSRQADRKGVLT
jgi:hypothetical protein